MTITVFNPTDAANQAVNTYVANNDGNWALAGRDVNAFAPHAQSSPNMTVAVNAGYLFDGAELVAVNAQSTATLTAPSTNPRNDIVYIDAATAAVGVATGAENVNPVDPALPAGKLPVTRIIWTVGATSITGTMLSDMRALNVLGLPPQIQDQQYVYADDAGSANAYAATVAPAPAALTAGQRAVFKAANANTGSSTFNWSGLGAQPIKKLGGAANLAAGDIVAGQIVDLEFDGTSWQMVSATGAASFSDPMTTRGDLIVRGASAAQRLAVGSANQILASDGTDPVWRSLSAEIDAAIGSTQGQILYRGASAWAALSAGTSGQFLKTQGSGANPVWASASSISAGTPLTLNSYAVSSSSSQAHGLGAQPKSVEVVLECLTAEGNYSVGDKILTNAGCNGDVNSSALRGWHILANATNLYLITSSEVPSLINKTTFTYFNITAANWKLTATPYLW